MHTVILIVQTGASNEGKNEKTEGQLLAKSLRLVLHCSQQESQYLNFS